MKVCVDIGTAQLNKVGEELCGDSVEVLNTDTDHILVVADGLGSGVKANILSRLTAKTASTMLKMGGSIDEVIETLASILPICKVRKLAYSTFTILQITQDGHAHLIEYENPPTFFGHGNCSKGLETVERVIDGKVIRECFFKVAKNDWLVVTTDGVMHAGTGKVWNMGWGWDRFNKYLAESYAPEKTATEWAGEVARLCNNIYGGKPGDDASIAVVKVRQTNSATIFIGPPRDKSDDERVVDQLMRADGLKVVCGGTTGNIVGRVLGREVRVDLSTCNDRVPPIGMIAGIDLVTEGAVTLVDALDLLKENPDIKHTRGRDGASMLASILLQADNVHFMVGTASNPAQQNAAIPAIYIYKEYIIRDLIRVLEELGKRVTAEFF